MASTSNHSETNAEKSEGSQPPQPGKPDLYLPLNVIPQIKQHLWKVSQLVVLQDRAQILRTVISPLTREILRNVEETLQFRKYYEEQLCQIYNYGLAFLNDIVMERLKIACWYVFALQLKCRRLRKSDSFVPHNILIELSLHRKTHNSWFAKKVLKRLEARPGKMDEPVRIIPLHDDYKTDQKLRDYVEIPIGEHQTISYLTAVIEIAIGQKNNYRESKRVQDDPVHITLTEEDESYLGKAKATLERNAESLGRICVKYIRTSAHGVS